MQRCRQGYSKHALEPSQDKYGSRHPFHCRNCMQPLHTQAQDSHTLGLQVMPCFLLHIARCCRWHTRTSSPQVSPMWRHCCTHTVRVPTKACTAQAQCTLQHTHTRTCQRSAATTEMPRHNQNSLVKARCTPQHEGLLQTTPWCSVLRAHQMSHDASTKH